MSNENVWYVTDWNNDKNRNWSYAYLKNSQSYLVFYTWDVPIAKVLNKEHAQLIAAAPEMLEALERMMENAIYDIELDKYTIEMSGFVASINKSIIAKAKGEQP